MKLPFPIRPLVEVARGCLFLAFTIVILQAWTSGAGDWPASGSTP